MPHQLVGSIAVTSPIAVAGEKEPEVPDVADALEERGQRIGNKPRLAERVELGEATKLAVCLSFAGA